MNRVISKTSYRMLVVSALVTSAGLMALVVLMSLHQSEVALGWLIPAILVTVSWAVIVHSLRARVDRDEPAWSWKKCVLHTFAFLLPVIALGVGWGWLEGR